MAPAELVVPAEHATGATVGSAHCDPAGQVVHAVFPVTIAKVPDGHWKDIFVLINNVVH